MKRRTGDSATLSVIPSPVARFSRTRAKGLILAFGYPRSRPRLRNCDVAGRARNELFGSPVRTTDRAGDLS
jgi:hypothetical protein